MNKVNKNSGFTLLEVVIATFILTMGITAAVNLIGSNIQLIGASKNRVIAASLAQEGIEVVRALRDTNWINGRVFDDALSFGDSCVDYSSDALFACDFKLYWDALRYTHAGPTLTPFERKISITDGTDSESVDFLRIQSIVTWEENSITVEEHLYDWK